LPPSRNRRIFLISETAGWVLFAIFATLYFGLRSPVLAAAVTVASLGAALLSASVSRPIDRLATGLILLRVGWLLLATYVSVEIALTNADPFFSRAG
jgi:tryptophan-rich sensory protein